MLVRTDLQFKIKEKIGLKYKPLSLNVQWGTVPFWMS